MLQSLFKVVILVLKLNNINTEDANFAIEAVDLLLNSSKTGFHGR
jgi:hypothetical protein